MTLTPFAMRLGQTCVSQSGVKTRALTADTDVGQPDAAVSSRVMAPNDSAWTHELRLQMPPRAGTLRAHQAFLEGLGSLKDVRWRSVSSEGASVAVGDQLQIWVEPTSLELIAYRTHLEQCAQPVLALLDEIVGPPVIRMTTRSQHLVPLDDVKYRDATEFAARAWLGPLSEVPGLIDCAVLLDGEVPRIGASYQVEYGVVEGSEVRDRLLRTVGRVTNSARLPGSPPSSDYPQVAVFADFTWRAKQPMARATGVQSCLATASGALEYAGEFVTVLTAQVAGAIEGGRA